MVLLEVPPMMSENIVADSAGAYAVQSVRRKGAGGRALGSREQRGHAVVA